jgi:hypothetical protein
MSNDGYELTIDYGEDGRAKNISFGTTSLPRYTPERLEVDTSLELKGTWVGEYYDSSGFNKLELFIEDENYGKVTDNKGETIDLNEFKATAGKVTGIFRYIMPKEFARWRTSDYADVTVELNAVNGKLKGILRSRGIATRITLNARVRM